LKNAFCKMCVAKSPANWGVQITGMIFQTRSKEEKTMKNKKAFGHALAIFTIFILLQQEDSDL